MSLRSSSLCALLLLFHPIFSPHALVASDAAGKINLYNDYGCNHPSTLNPKVSLPLYTCLVTTGGEGLVIGEFPPCPQGTATTIYYQDTACGVQVTVSSSTFSDACFQLAAGDQLYVARAVMFSCKPAANNPQPSSTSTAVVSALAAVATGSSDSNGSGSSTSAAGSTPTDSSTQRNSTGSSGGNSNSNGGTSTTTGRGFGLDTGDIIALVVGLGVGIPSILIAFAAWRYPVVRNKLKGWVPGRLDQQTQQWPYHGAHEMDSPQRPFQRH